MFLPTCLNIFFFFNDTATTEIYTLSLHDALPISSTRHSSPKNAQSTCRTPRGVLPARVPPEDRGVVGRGGGAMVGDSTLPTSPAASYFRPMGFWRRLLGGGGSSGDALKPHRLRCLNEAL